MPPLTYDASGLSKNTTSPATSSGSPKRCIGMRASSRSCAPSPSAVSNCRTIGVSIGAGHTALTRMPRRASSTAAVRVRPTTACLLAEYGPSVGDARSPATDAVFTIAPPPRAIMTGATALRPSHTPLTFTASTRSKVASEHSISGPTSPRMPALLKKRSMPPKRSAAAVVYRRTSSQRVTSASTASAAAPARSAATSVCFNVSGTRSTSTRLAPSDARRAATARPMPPPAPVMTATLPVKRPISERGDDRDLDEELLLRQLRLDGGARRCVDGIDPGVPRRVHLIVRLHLGEVHGGRQQIRLVGADGGQERVDLLQDGLGLRLCRRLVARHLTGEVDGVAVGDGPAHAGAHLGALDAHDQGPFRMDGSGCPKHNTP